MIRGNNILGILFANVHEEKIRELTEKLHHGFCTLWWTVPSD